MAMDPSLLKERQAFVKCAKNAPPLKISCSDVRNDYKKSQHVTLMSALRPHIRAATSSNRHPLAFDEPSEASGRFKFLATIVKHMKTRHLEGNHQALSVDEILEEVSLLNLDTSVVLWLTKEALPNNPKICMTPDGKFVFKPKYNIHDRTELYRLLRTHEIEGLGGVEFDDIDECIKDAGNVIKSLGDTVFDYTNPHNKKRVIYFNDTRFDLKLDEKFKELWRSTNVVGVSEQEVEKYLEKYGLNSISADKAKSVSCPATSNNFKRKITKRRNPRPAILKHNEHVKDILMDYSEHKPPDV